jgi:hypothetical protein
VVRTEKKVRSNICYCKLDINLIYAGDQSLFEGGSVETKFCKWLAAVLESLNTEEQMEFGGQVADLGSHSFRKGISSMLAGLVGVSTISIFLRAGWSLGNVQQRYLFASEGGDQLVGRAACGLPITDSNFSILPPHFVFPPDYTPAPEDWECMVPRYSQYPATFQAAIPMLVASVVYHGSWLDATLPPCHPLRTTRFWTRSYHTTYLQFVKLGHGHCRYSGMRASGIPPNIVISNAVNDLSEQVQVGTSYLWSFLCHQVCVGTVKRGQASVQRNGGILQCRCG